MPKETAPEMGAASIMFIFFSILRECGCVMATHGLRIDLE